jgi:5-methylcytosine-specific restriction protein A
MTTTKYSHLYNATWRKMRAAHLAAHPLCVDCQRRGRLTAATVCDHIRNHNGDPALFYDAANLQSLCHSCHSGAKQSFDRTGRIRGCDANGMPLDPNHPWRSDKGGGAG